MCVSPFPPSILPFKEAPVRRKKTPRGKTGQTQRSKTPLVGMEDEGGGEKLIPFRHPCNIFPFLPIQTCYGEAEAALQLFDKCAQILAGSTVSIFQPVVFSLYIPLSRLSVGVEGREGKGRA